MSMMSPSLTAAMGPPAYASGDTWPMASQAPSDDEAGGREHLGHSGGSLGPLIPDDDDISSDDLPGGDGLGGVGLSVEDAGGSRELHHLGADSGLLDDGSLGGEVALEDGDASLVVEGVVQGPDDLGVLDGGMVCDLVDGETVGSGEVDELSLEHLEDRRDPASAVQVLDGVGACGPEAGDVRGVPGDLVEVVESDGASELLGDGGQVEGRVGGSSDGHVHADGVAERVAGDDVAGLDVLLDELDDAPSGLPGDLQLPVVVSEGCGASGQADTEGLGQAGHGVGREKPGAAAPSGACGALHGVELVLVDLPGAVGSDRLEDGLEVHVAVLSGSGLHGPAGDDEAGDVHPSHCHEHPGGDLVAVGDADPSVEGVAFDHHLAAVGDDLPGDQGVPHALVAHGDTVAHCGDSEGERPSAGLDDPFLDSLDDLVEVDVPGDDLVPGVGYPDERFVEIFVCKSVGPKKAPLGSCGRPFLDCIASHHDH